jgi:hypothetical protein
MSSPLRVSSKVKLAEALGISRPTLYAFLRLPDSPPARNGYWYVGDFRKFITRKRDSVSASEKEQLQINCLKVRLEREQHELAEARQSTNDRLRREWIERLHEVFSILRTRLYHERLQCAPRCEGRGARQIFAVLDEGERRAFNTVADAIMERAGQTVTEESTRVVKNVIEFEERKAATG